MRYSALGHRLPHAISAPLFGDRRRFGTHPDSEDPGWQEWLKRNTEFYEANQRQSVGRRVNHSGYRIMESVDLTGKRVLEIGPGALDHINYWKAQPEHFTCLDIDEGFLTLAANRLQEHHVPHELRLYAGGDSGLPFGDSSFDVVLTFYALEHIAALGKHLSEVHRVLRPGGVLAGAIPCEGGLAWGTGRYFTSRRWLLHNTTIDPNRLICWEHPNFADKVLNALQQHFDSEQIAFWPSRVPVIDLNLIARFRMTRTP